MTKNKIELFMYFLIAIGLLAIVYGAGIALFTNRISQGEPEDIMLIASLIAGGLFISVPAKIYLTLLLLKNK